MVKEQRDPKYSLLDLFLIFLIFAVLESVFYLLFPQGVPLLFVLILHSCYVVIVLFWTFKYRKWTKADLGLIDLTNSKKIWNGIGMGLLLAFAFIGIDSNTVYLLVHEAKLTLSNFFLLIFILPLVTLLAPLEEIFYRGFLFTLLKKRLNLNGGVVLSSLIFAFAHKLGGGTESIYSIKIVAFIQKFILGGIFAYLFYFSKSLTGPTWAHIVYNWCVITVYALTYYTES